MPSITPALLGSVPRSFGDYLSCTLRELFNLVWSQRPRALEVACLFHAYSQLLSPSITREFVHVRLLPKYAVWKSSVLPIGWQKEVFHYFQLASIYNCAEDKNAAVNIWLQLIRDVNIDLNILNAHEVLGHFAIRHTAAGHNTAAISVWAELLSMDLAEESIDALSRACGIAHEDTETQYWIDLIIRHPNTIPFVQRLLESSVSRKSLLEVAEETLDDQPHNAGAKLLFKTVCEAQQTHDLVIAKYRQRLSKRPWDSWLQQQLAGAFDRKGSNEIALSAWAELVTTYPDVVSLREKLVDACTGRRSKYDNAALYEAILQVQPKDEWLQSRLADVYREIGKPDRAIAGWSALVDSYTNVSSLKSQLADAYEWKGDFAVAAEVWTTLALEDAIEWAPRLAESFRASGEREIDVEVATWIELLELYPDNMMLCEQLDDVFFRYCTIDMALAGWSQLEEKNPDSKIFFAMVVAWNLSRQDSEASTRMREQILSGGDLSKFLDELDVSNVGDVGLERDREGDIGSSKTIRQESSGRRSGKSRKES